jgi:hypothetical protein
MLRKATPHGKTERSAPTAAERNSSRERGRWLSEQNLSRARFLRLVGSGLGLSLIPSSLAFWGGRFALGASASILADGRYPIGLWSPPPPDETTVERYQEIAAAGFNFVIGGNGVNNDDVNPAALEAATASNLRFLLTDARLQRNIHHSTAPASPSTQEPTSSDPSEEVRLRIQQLLQRYAAEYPAALAGLVLIDEPSRAMFETVGYAREVLQELAPEQLPYVNVWPSYAPLSALGTATYEEYLRLYLSEVKPPLLCFDHYPLLSGTQITSDYFYNWATIRRFSLQAGIPSWVFIQSVDYWGDLQARRRPKEVEILWQVNVSLAYGAKGIQYFTYWTPDVAPDAWRQFGEALVSVEGQLTPLYYYAKRVNQYLKVVGKVLLPLTTEDVVHAGEKSLPRGAKAFKADGGYVKSTSGSPVILSRFRKPTGGTERYVFVANRSFVNQAETRLTLYDSVNEVFELDSQTGTFARVAQQGTLLVRLAPGGARLYSLRAI